MKAILSMAIVVAEVGGCGTVSSVQGWAGGPVRTGVQDGTAMVRYEAPRPGWTLTVDRSKLAGDTAVLWITAAGATRGPLEPTTVTAYWRPHDSTIQCAQVNIRLPGQPDYVPAGVGCGPLPE